MPGGRPPKGSDVITHRPVVDPDTHQPTGETVPVTRIDQICDDLAIGMPAHRAAQRAGIAVATFYLWEKTAGRARATRASGGKLTADEKRCLEFLDRVMDAELRWEARQNATLEQISRGGILQETVVEKVDDKGKVTRTVTSSATLPDARTTLTRLRQRFPKNYQDRVVIEGTGEDGAIPVEHRVQSLADALAQFQAAE